MSNANANSLLTLGLTPVLLGNAGEKLKAPIQTNWPNLRPTAADVARWPAANNVGIRLGETADPGRFVYCFDFDNEAETIFANWRERASELVSETPVVVATGKGFHFYVYNGQRRVGYHVAEADPAVEPDGKKRVLIELRGFGQPGQANHMMVAAGGRHPNGGQYRFISGGYSQIPTVDDVVFDQLVDLAKTFDRRPANDPVVVRRAEGGERRPGRFLQGTGELATVADCLDYVERFVAGKVKKQGKDYRVEGQGYGGLTIRGDRTGWFLHSAGIGGGLADLVAWHRNITRDDAAAMLREKPQAHYTLRAGEYGTTIHLTGGQFMGDVVVDEDGLPKRANLRARTGVGKTTWAAELPGQVVLIVPTQAVLEQLQAHHAADCYYQHSKTATNASRLILTTPESFGRLLQKIDAGLFTLVVDESHLIPQAGFRRRAYADIVAAVGPSAGWRRVVLMSGTPLPLVGGELAVFENVVVGSDQREQPATRVVWRTPPDEKGKTRGDLVAAVGLHLDPRKDVRHLIYVNDKGKRADALHFECRRRGYDWDSIAFVNADRRGDRAYRSIVNDEVLPDDVRVVIATAIIETGVNLRNPGERWAVHFASAVSSVEAQQVVSRFRDQSPVVYWYNAGIGAMSRGDYVRTGSELLQAAEAIAAELNAAELTELVDAAVDDAMLAEYRHLRRRHAARLGTGVLVEFHRDPFDDEDLRAATGYWRPSAVGVNNVAFDIMRRAETRHPDLFKVATGRYNWRWADDVVAVVELTRAERKERDGFVEERAEERAVYVGALAEDLRKLVVDDARAMLRGKKTADEDLRAVARIAVRVDEVNGNDWSKACDAAAFSELRTRRANSLVRRLEIQNDRDRDPLARWFYSAFLVGERLTPDAILTKIREHYLADPWLRSLVADRPGGWHPETMTARKAVGILTDFYSVKRCKIDDGDGRVNGWELVDDCGSVAGVSVRQFRTVAETVSETCLTKLPEDLTKFSETKTPAVTRPPAGQPPPIILGGELVFWNGSRTQLWESGRQSAANFAA